MATGLFNLKQVNQAISQGAWSGYIAPKWVEYLVVAGGGGGGAGTANSNGAGAGAGGLLTGIVTVAAGTSYTVTVGAGGSGASLPSTNGSNSVFGSIASLGGGYGAYGGSYTVGGSGGSGGGGAGYAGSVNAGGSATSGQGNSGGIGYGVGLGGSGGGGGGGAGTVGLNALTSGPAGNGGAGIASAITGTVVTYAGGGGAGSGGGNPLGAGGIGGGGSGTASGAGKNGAANTGGGGGGANGTFDGGTGGSGVVVVRYPGNVQFYTGGAITYANGYIVHTFVASGTLAPTTPTVVTADYQISRSLRFNVPDTTYLNRTPASASNRKTWTWSGWVKLGQLSILQYGLFSSRSGVDSTRFTCGLYNDNTFLVSDVNSSNVGVMDFQTTQVFRDPSAWYHFVMAVDTTQATNTNRFKMYVNGVQVTSFVSANYPSQNADTGINAAIEHNIGKYALTGNYVDGYMTEVNFIDGQALTPSSFGATNANTGVWGPKAYTGTYGTNGFYLNFSDNSNTTAATLGKDYSGNGNNWTPNNFSVTAGAGNDSLVDVPTNYGTDYGVGGAVRGNYATLNPLSFGTLTRTFSNGNLSLAVTSSSEFKATATIGVTSGKWYWEVTATLVTDSRFIVGVADSTWLASDLGDTAYSYGYIADARKYNNGSTSAYGATYTTNDIIGVALDMDAGTLTFYKNGTSQGQAFSGITQQMFPAIGSTGGASAESCVLNFGQRAWAYTPPAGFNALVTQNLPSPTVGSSPTTLANLYFDTSLYTGTNATQSITNAGFQPDLVWPKARSIAYAANIIDSVRGSHKVLIPSSTAAEATSSTANGITAFNSNGFTLGLDTDTTGSTNASGQTFVAWQWKANGGTGVTNTAGSITSTVSANTTSGFSVVTYTGTGSVATVGHGLGFAPYMVIVKRRDGVADWATWHTSIGTQVLFLNLTNAAASGTAQWNGTTPTSSVFTVSTSSGVNGSGGTYVAYCFAPIAGFSAFGTYTGNGSSDGVFVFTGMRPAYVLIKRTTSAYNWWILDAARGTINAVKGRLYADATDAESTTYPYMDFLSNGFKLRDADGGLNASGAPYIYACFAQNPFKYSLAR